MKKQYYQFQYVGMNSQGIRKKGVLVASSSKDVVNFLHRLHVTPLKIRQSNIVLSALREGYFKFRFFLRQKSALKLQIFTQFSDLLGSNYSVLQVVETMCFNVKQMELKLSLHKVLKDLDSGFSLAFGLNRHLSHLIDPIEIKIIAHAEKMGHLPEAFKGLKENAKNRAAKSGKNFVLLSPYIAALMGTVLVLNGFVGYYEPRISETFRLLGSEYPQVVALLFSLFKGNIIVRAVCVGGIASVLMYFLKDILRVLGLKKRIDFWVVKIPYFNEIDRLKNMVQFILGLSMSIKARIPLQEALKDGIDALPSVRYQAELKGIVQGVYSGFDVTQELFKSTMFSDNDISLLVTAIQSGQLEKEAHFLLAIANIKLNMINLITFNLIKYSLILLNVFLLALAAAVYMELNAIFG